MALWDEAAAMGRSLTIEVKGRHRVERLWRDTESRMLEDC
jgi:hypothetical protein